MVISLISAGSKAAQVSLNSWNIASILPGYIEKSHIRSISSSVIDDPSKTMSSRDFFAMLLDQMRLIKKRPNGFFIALSAMGGELSSLTGAPLADRSTRLLTLSGLSRVYLAEILPPHGVPNQNKTTYSYVVDNLG